MEAQGNLYNLSIFLLKNSTRIPNTEKNDTNCRRTGSTRLITTNIVNQGRYGRTQRIKLHIHISSVNSY